MVFDLIIKFSSSFRLASDPYKILWLCSLFFLTSENFSPYLVPRPIKDFFHRDLTCHHYTWLTTSSYLSFFLSCKSSVIILWCLSAFFSCSATITQCWWRILITPRELSLAMTSFSSFHAFQRVFRQICSGLLQGCDTRESSHTIITHTNTWHIQSCPHWNIASFITMIFNKRPGSTLASWILPLNPLVYCASMLHALQIYSSIWSI